MKTYRKKATAVVQARQWFHLGDGGGGRGEVVRHYYRADVPGETPCSVCSVALHCHGWISTLEGGHIVCPGDWIITGVRGEKYPCKPDIFEETYEAVE